MHRPDPHATRDHWDRLAGEYDDAKRRNDGYYRSLKACFDSAVPQVVRGRVLEVGCGTGQVLASLRPLNGVGIDLSPQMIENAKRRYAQRRELTFAAMDAASAAGLGEFDAVISADVMEHVEDWQAVIRAMVKACRVGGVIAITTPNPRWTLPLWLLEKAMLKMPEGPHRFVSARAIASTLSAMRCVVQRVSTHAIVPARLKGVGPLISAWSEHLPLLRDLGVIQLIVAEKQESNP